MNEHDEDVDRKLSEVLQSHFALSQEHEDALWARFQARRAQEAAAWGAFAATMVLVNARLQPAHRASMLLFNSGQRS